MIVELEMTAIRFGKDARLFTWEQEAKIDAPSRGEVERAASVILAEFQETMEGDRVFGRLEIAESRGGIRRWTTWRVELAATVFVPPPGPTLTAEQEKRAAAIQAREETRKGIQPLNCPVCGDTLNHARKPMCHICFNTLPEPNRTDLTNAYAGGLGKKGKPFRAAVLAALDVIEKAEKGEEHTAPTAAPALDPAPAAALVSTVPPKTRKGGASDVEQPALAIAG